MKNYEITILKNCYEEEYIDYTKMPEKRTKNMAVDRVRRHAIGQIRVN